MENITVLTNPDQKYWDDLVKHVVVEEGWINSTHDYKAFKDSFSDGNFILLVAVDKDSQEFIGSVCVATYTEPEPLSSIGMYYVLPSYQGKGIGSYLFKEAIKLCAPRKFLYGVENMMPKYRDVFGFNKIPDWHLVTARMENRKVKPLKLNHDPTLVVKPPEACGWDEIAKYYRKFLPYLDASALIKSLLTEPQVHCGVAVTNENRIVSLVRVRETYNNELSIGPLLGNDAIAACTALRHVLCRLETLRQFKSIVMQFPNTNSEVHNFLNQMVDDGDYKIGGVTYPQFTDQILEVPIQHIYAVSQNDIAIV
ncbi:Acetyltransferase, GNAT family [Aphelenchoides bicaudatus]|nr:Acetyltransferase, GNAT family [Aphelenchoides bicaudatus]